MLGNGSSPRMWGTGYRQAQLLTTQRFIPTYVGNRFKSLCPVILATVHPHVCGEQVSTRSVIAPDPGSSPRMWGTGRQSRREGIESRFIPTYVGNSGSVSAPGGVLTVHPHVCGEQLRNSFRSLRIIGSSPRMWGTVIGRSFFQSLCRFIPTYVGNSYRNGNRRLNWTVHPHVCGEQANAPR